MLAVKKAGMQLATLEGAVTVLQHNNVIIVYERKQALCEAEQLKVELVESKRLVEQLAAEKKELLAKVGGLQG